MEGFFTNPSVYGNKSTGGQEHIPLEVFPLFSMCKTKV